MKSARNLCPLPFSPTNTPQSRWPMYPAKLTLSLNSCTFATSIKPNPRMTITFSVRQYLIQTGQPKRARGKENIAYLRHVVLDFENGELQPETLPNLFPDLQMVVTNTFNHTSDKPRFRAVFFTSECMTPEVYSLIYGYLADKLEEAGYSVDRKDKRLKSSRLSNSHPSGLGLVEEPSHQSLLFSMPSGTPQG